MSADYESIIRAAVDRLPPDDIQGRGKLYARARAFITETAALASSERPGAVDRIEAAIARVEAAVAPPPSAIAAARHGGSRRWIGWASAALVACAVAIPVIVFSMRDTGLHLEGPVMSDFDGPDSGFVQVNGKPFTQSDGERYEFRRVDERSVLFVEGRAQLISADRYRVDTSKLYRMEIGLRSVATDKSHASRVNAGVATYDADGKLQTDAPGTHRYFAMQEALSTLDDWQQRSGFITGEGNRTHTTFRPGTRYVRPIVLVNYGSAEQAVEIDYVRFDECSTPTDCRAVQPETEGAAKTK
ncbi:MAG: hypothetical protein H6883_03560 [Rhodobiaceae bacterium]|nr:hypothetical protein [Rhodobiaceae bacterium]MCC0055193.1 hypothetical protein [Rhodobiaceae bacterium]